MELRHLRYFVAVADERHFGRAAEKIGIGQPPLSQQIQALERELGTPLFRRIPRKLELTHAGETLLADARWILDRADQAVIKVSRASRGEIGRLSLGFTFTSSFHPSLPATIRRFRETYPDVALTLREEDSEVLCHMLVDGQMDVAFIRPPASDPDRVVLEALFEEDMVVAMACGHPLEKSDTVALAALANQPFVFYPRKIGPSLYDAVIMACLDAGFTPRVVQEAPQIPSAINLVASGIGVAIVPASMQQIHSHGVVYRRVRGKAPRAPLSLASRRGETVATVRNFIQIARSAAWAQQKP